MTVRIGQGYDVHRLEDGRRLVLGGVEIAHPQGLRGHSDADVVTHAVANAVLGSLALGDLGTHFPDSDPRWKDVSSLALLAHAVRLVLDRGYAVVNCDATIVAQEPRLAAHIAAMRDNLAHALGCTPDDVSVKATTHEGLGALGRAEGIAAHAVVLVAARSG